MLREELKERAVDAGLIGSGARVILETVGQPLLDIRPDVRAEHLGALAVGLFVRRQEHRGAQNRESLVSAGAVGRRETTLRKQWRKLCDPIAEDAPDMGFRRSKAEILGGRDAKTLEINRRRRRPARAAA